LNQKHNLPVLKLIINLLVLKLTINLSILKLVKQLIT